jgi:hypothetical protein
LLWRKRVAQGHDRPVTALLALDDANLAVLRRFPCSLTSVHAGGSSIHQSTLFDLNSIDLIEPNPAVVLDLFKENKNISLKPRLPMGKFG